MAMEKNEINIRFAKNNELELVNSLRKQVVDLHGRGVPEIFKSSFTKEMAGDIYDIWKDPKQEILVAEVTDIICGFAVLKYTCTLEDIYMKERSFLEIDEFGVDKNYKGLGIASEMISFIREFALQKGIQRIELSMWEFNQDALAFYETVGFKTYRRYMEITI